MKDFWKKQRLLIKLIAIVLVSIFITLTVLYVLFSRRMMISTQENEGDFLLKLSRHLASRELVINATENEEASVELQHYTASINENFHLDYAVVMTENSIRLSHPEESLIYQPFQGGDQYPAFEGQEYTSTAEGTLGQSLRSFVPIYNASQDVVGAVSLGMTTQNLQAQVRQNMQPLTVAFVISTALGISLATIAAYSLKKQMLDMEPHEIARVLEERNSMMDHAADAVLVTNSQGEIILANREAEKRFSVDKTKDSQLITNLLPFLNHLPYDTNASSRGDLIYPYENKDYVVSFAPIIVKEQIVGHIYTLRDATDLYLLTNQLYSTSEYAHTLESQSHDFLNKLHVIYGLTDLEEYDELKDYLQQLIEPEQEFSKRVAYLIHSPVMSGYLVGERRKFAENQLNFTIEIYPDIPEAKNFREIQPWIQQVDYINKLILETDSITEVHLELGYFNEKLITIYHVRGKISAISNQIEQSMYTKSILNKGENWVKIHFEYPYHKTDKKHRFGKYS